MTESPGGLAWPGGPIEALYDEGMRNRKASEQVAADAQEAEKAETG